MARRRSLIAIMSIAAIVLATVTGLAAVEEDSTARRIPFPDIPRGQGENCVEDTDFMRRNHMNLLKHQRDDTMLKGIRTKQHSLKECVSCHAVEGADAVPLTAASPKHFCRSCHDYAAVQIDCFQCHASRPVITAGTGEQ